VSYMADRIAVLKAGQVVEVNSAAALIADPQHDYTKALVAAAPQLRNTQQLYQSASMGMQAQIQIQERS